MQEPSTENFFIVSHSNRLKELTQKFGYTLNEIKNGGILLLSIKKKDDKTISISIDKLHNGGDVLSEENQGYITGPTQQFADERDIETLLPKITLSYSVTYNFFLVRHGEGVHNRKKDWSLSDAAITVANMSRADPELTALGIRQAEQAGTALKKYFNENRSEKPKNYFVSILQRTHQTLAHILSKFLDGPSEIKAIVLPKNEEFSKFSNSQFKSKENDSLCITQEQQQATVRCRKIVNTNLTIDWEFYNKYPNISDDENMISLAIKIDNVQEPIQLESQTTVPHVKQISASTDNGNFGIVIKGILGKLFSTKMSGGKHRTNHHKRKQRKTMKKR
jgi:bisphosphoglycerate-dependent phosphoglycerate mutase